MAEITFNWDFQAEEPSKIHCGQCGYAQTVRPSLSEVRSGFRFYCLKCGAPFTIAGREVSEPVQNIPLIGAIAYGLKSGVASIVLSIAKDRQRVIVQHPDGRKYSVPLSAIARWEMPQHQRALIQTPHTDKTATLSQWIECLTGQPQDVVIVAKFGSTVAARYRAIYGRSPSKQKGTSVYSGQELNCVLALMTERKDSLIDFLSEWRVSS